MFQQDQSKGIQAMDLTQNDEPQDEEVTSSAQGEEVPAGMVDAPVVAQTDESNAMENMGPSTKSSYPSKTSKPQSSNVQPSGSPRPAWANVPKNKPAQGSATSKENSSATTATPTPSTITPVVVYPGLMSNHLKGAGGLHRPPVKLVSKIGAIKPSSESSSSSLSQTSNVPANPACPSSTSTSSACPSSTSTTSIATVMSENNSNSSDSITTAPSDSSSDPTYASSISTNTATTCTPSTKRSLSDMQDQHETAKNDDQYDETTTASLDEQGTSSKKLRAAQVTPLPASDVDLRHQQSASLVTPMASLTSQHIVYIDSTEQTKSTDTSLNADHNLALPKEEDQFALPTFPTAGVSPTQVCQISQLSPAAGSKDVVHVVDDCSDDQITAGATAHKAKGGKSSNSSVPAKSKGQKTPSKNAAAPSGKGGSSKKAAAATAEPAKKAAVGILSFFKKV